MIRRRANSGDFCLRLTTLLLPLFAFAIAGQIRFFSGLVPLKASDINPAPYFGLLLFTTLAWGEVAEYFGLCDVEQLYRGSGKTGRLLSACIVTYAAVAVITFFYREVSFSRLFVSLSAGALFVLGLLTRIGFRVILDRNLHNGKGAVRLLIVGADKFAVCTALRLLSGHVMPCSVVGFVRLPDQQVDVRGEPVFELQNIQGLALGNGIDDIVIAVPPARFAEIPQLMSKLEPLCSPIRAVLDFGEGVSIHDKLFDLGGIPLLDLQTTPAESVEYLVLKRAFDILFSLFALVTAAPLMVLIALAIRLTSPGPVLFIQERVGLNGKLFRMYKFRTMRAGAQKETDTRWTTAGDPRRTKLGTILRRTNLDELPQLLNVLKGDMSMVGPRPERPYFVQKFVTDLVKYNSRHHLKVGITGWAQVNGLRGNTSIAKRLEYDLYYLQNWSLTFDLQIILLTFLRGFRDENAY